MSILDFPANPSNGDSYIKNGVTYIYNNGGWTSTSQTSLNDAYVNVSGDVMTGNLGVGVGKIVLNATTGKATSTSTVSGDVGTTLSESIIS